MARVEQIKASVSECNAPAFAARASEYCRDLISIDDLALIGIVGRSQSQRDILAGDDLRADTAYFDARGKIGDGGGRREAQSGYRQEAEKGQHHIAGCRDVVNLARRRRDISI